MPLSDYAEDTFAHAGAERRVFRRGTGPAVVVIAEMPGITPAVVAFADRVVELGCTAVLPHLFGTPGDDVSAPNALRSLVPACVSREFTTWATGRTSPVVAWLRALGRREHERCGPPGIGVVGMCFTGGFAVAMAVDDHVLAPVSSQPGLPAAITRAQKRDVGVSPDDLATVAGRGADASVLGLRFTADRMCPPERFAHLHEALGDAFVAVEVDSGPGNPFGIRRTAHSVLTEHLVDEPGHPTRDALDRVLDLFRRRLVEATERG